MSPESWGTIEELFIRGLDAPATLRQKLLDEVSDPQVAAAVVRLWADASEAPSNFLGNRLQDPAAVTYKVGDVVAGRFTLESLLGYGGMGHVFRARDARLDRSVALKFLTPGLARHPVMRGLIEREARAICRLGNHPNICTVHDFYWDGDTPFLVMEFLAGETLAARLTRGPLPVQDAIAVAISIADGLVHAHAQNVIHRDLKPGNVMLTPFGPKLFDFGIAKRVEPASPSDASILSAPGGFVGSVSYTSPEQAEALSIDIRSDIFSLGCVLYEMMTGVKAFDGPTRISALAAVIRGEPTPMQELNPSVPADYVHVVTTCLEKDPSRRFQRSTEVRDALDRLARKGILPTHADQGAGANVSRPSKNLPISGLLARGSLHPVTMMVSLAFGAMVGLALLAEIAYEWPTFGVWALRVAALTGAASVGVSLAALAVLRHRVMNQRAHALLVTLGIYLGWAVLLAIAIAPQLPDRALVRATFQTMTANVGYPKSLIEALALPVLAVVPLQIVSALESQLLRGRAEFVRRVLTGNHAAAIPGTVVVSPTAASIVFATVAIWWIGANARLLESLENGPYYALFLQIAFARAASGLLTLFAVLGWYTWTLNELRHDAQEEDTVKSATEA